MSESVKPVVYFKGTPEFVKGEYIDVETNEFKEYEYAIVNALGHPILGNCIVHTSTIVKKLNDNNAFETLNTIYLPYEE